MTGDFSDLSKTISDYISLIASFIPQKSQVSPLGHNIILGTRNIVMSKALSLSSRCLSLEARRRLIPNSGKYKC